MNVPGGGRAIRRGVEGAAGLQKMAQNCARLALFRRMVIRASSRG